MNELDYAAKYLAHYGYVPEQPEGAKGLSVQDLASALSTLQAVGGIPMTGELDEATIDLMKQPRCGCRDVQRMVESIEYARWRKSHLTYYVAQYVHGISVPEQEAIILKAWGQWSSVAGIVLERVDSPQADIVISVGRGGNQGFDGPSGTLAWAQLPNGGDLQLLMRFDLDEQWTIDNPAGGVILLNVACHEFGHLLGLDHSRMPTALMAPFYKPSISKPQPSDDIPRIQALYGPPVAAPKPPKPEVPKMGFPIDAIRQLLAFFNGSDKSYKKAAKALGEIITYAADFLPDNSAVVEELTDEQAMGYLNNLANTPEGTLAASLIPWQSILLWLLKKFLAG